MVLVTGASAGSVDASVARLPATDFLGGVHYCSRQEAAEETLLN